MLIVTHEMRFARDVAHRTIFMDGGLIAEQGPSAKLFSKPKNARLKEFPQARQHVNRSSDDD